MQSSLAQLLCGWLTREQRVELRQRLNRLLRPAFPGTLRRTTPLSRRWGYDRGLPVDRYYIERFLAEHRRDIRGCVLEVKDSEYTTKYGTNVERIDVIDIDPGNARASVVIDLAGPHTSGRSAEWDCFVLTQTLHLIYDIRAAIACAGMLLRPGGVLLATLPALSPVMAPNDRYQDYWRVTTASAGALFAEVFGTRQVSVRSYGNVLSAIAFLTGMASEELSPREIDTNDNDIPVLIAVRAVKLGAERGYPA